MFFVIFVVSHLDFECRNLALIVPVPGHCLPFAFHNIMIAEVATYKKIKIFVWRKCDFGRGKHDKISSNIPNTLVWAEIVTDRNDYGPK